MQALKDRISSKLGEKTKSKEKDGTQSLKNPSPIDGKHSTTHDSHHHQLGSSSSSPLASNVATSNVQSAEKGIESIDAKENNEINLYPLPLRKYII